MSEIYVDHERRIRTLERKNYPDFKTIFYSKEDCFISDEEQKIGFSVAKKGLVVFTLNFNADCAGIMDFFVNDVKTKGYKSVIGYNCVTFSVFLNVGLNFIKIAVSGAVPDFNLTVSGYVDEITYERTTQILRKENEIYIAYYDEYKYTLTLYQKNEKLLDKICDVENVKSGGVSMSDQGICDLYYVKSDGTLYSVNVRNGTTQAPVSIDQGVTCVSGAKFSDRNGCYYVKEQKVYRAEKSADEFTVEKEGVSGAYSVQSSPQIAGVYVVTGYDKVATLYIKGDDETI